MILHSRILHPKIRTQILSLFKRHIFPQGKGPVNIGKH